MNERIKFVLAGFCVGFAELLPGISGSTSHIRAPEPLSSGILTILSMLGGSNDGPT